MKFRQKWQYYYYYIPR